MSIFNMKRHDTLPVLSGTITDANGAVSLASATEIRIIMTDSSGAIKVDSTGGVADADQVTNKGLFTYPWIAADTDTSGDYKLEVQITFPAGKQTFPNPGYSIVRIVDDLNDA